MTDPHTLAEEAGRILQARNSDRTHYEDCWRDHPYCLAAFLADALITALEDVEEQRGNAEGFWEDRERFREENERLREALERVEVSGHPEWCAWSCFGGAEESACDCWVMPVRQALTKARANDDVHARRSTARAEENKRLREEAWNVVAWSEDDDPSLLTQAIDGLRKT